MHFKSVFISDVHLGSPDCQYATLLDFLQFNSCDHLYLVGDIIDFWALKKRHPWPDEHTQVLSAFLKIAELGVKVTYLPGNHDDPVRRIYGSRISGIEVVEQVVHVTARGERLLVLHGDQFDAEVLTRDWRHRIGGDLYDMLMVLSRKLNVVRRLFGFCHWSLANYLKYQFADAVKHIEDYEYAAAKAAAMHFVDGVICGHIHHPNNHDIEGIHYLNCGDWVENCTLLAEEMSGEMVLIDWRRQREALMTRSQCESLSEKQVRRRFDRAA